MGRIWFRNCARLLVCNRETVTQHVADYQTDDLDFPSPPDEAEDEDGFGLVPGKKDCSFPAHYKDPKYHTPQNHDRREHIRNLTRLKVIHLDSPLLNLMLL